MKEVSCRVFDVFLLRLKQRGIPADALVHDTDVSLTTLQNRNERISWSDLVAIMRNTRQIFTDEEYVEIGQAFLRSPMMRFVSVIGRILFTARDFYGWLTKAKDGAGNQMFTCIATSSREIGTNELEVELKLFPGYEMCWDFFVVSKGMFMEVPRFAGLPVANVELTRVDDGARYRIVYPVGDPIVSRVRRAMLWPFTARAAARELKDAHETLLQRFEQLEDARVRLDRQAKRLRVAHAVSALAHRDVDLDRTLEAIAHALVEEAGFASARVEVDTVVDGLALERTSSHGTVGESELRCDLRVRAEHAIGELRVTVRGDEDRAERSELLEFIAPTVSMAIDNAVSYRAVEEYRKTLEARVIERTAELSQALRRLEEANATRDRIFANVNHEIRTPLSMILLVVDQARANPNSVEPAQRARNLVMIETAARKLLRLVDEMLLLAQGREGDLPLRMMVVDLGDLVAKIAQSWEVAARAAELDLAVDTQKESWVRADPDALERVVSNLVSNAVKYTPRGGAVALTVAHDGTRARISVRDNGIGIDDELRQRLFGRFERGKPAIDRGVAGSGLGLSLARDLVAAHSGTIDVDSTVGAGTTVRVSLPLVAHAGDAIAVSPKLVPQDFGVPVTTPETHEVYEPPGPPRSTLLLAEDDPSLRDEIARLLSDEHRVIAAKDGFDALRLAELHRPDILVTDVAMPGMDGIELTRRFLDQNGGRVAPVLVLTAFGEIRDRLAGFEAGAVDYIVKPFEPAELKARVRSQLALRALAMKLLETERLAALGRLSAGLAHEMRNPANGIVNAVEPLREALPPELLDPEGAVAQLLDVVDRCSKQIAMLSRHLLGFRRGAELERRPVAIDALLTRVRATASGSLEGIELRERFEYTGPVPCAEPLLQQAFANLLDNAAQAAGRGGWIELRTVKEETKVVVEIRDSGSGIPAEFRDRIFEPFFTTKPPGSGTGLGLATAREIVTRHGGTLALGDAGGPTVFRVEMPLESEAAS
jgi:signal transduction histidine kinase